MRWRRRVTASLGVRSQAQLLYASVMSKAGMSKAGRIVATAKGGPEVLEYREDEVPAPGHGELLLRQTAVGVNFIDVYYRTGAYPAGEPPFGLGSEACAVVEEVGPGVEGFAAGDRVAYAGGALGAYSERRVFPAARVVKVPASIGDETAAAMMLKGMTAEYLLRRTYPVKAGDRVLVHAAAGGVGLIACQWAKHLGATVIGTVSTDAKAELARANGCDHVILYSREEVPARVRELTSGEGVNVVYDSVGKDTFQGSLDCLAPRGVLALFGQSSGKVDAFDPQVLNAKGSLYLTRPSLNHYTATRADLELSAKELFDVVASGAVKIRIGATYPLRDAAEAHRALEGRKTTGSVVLAP
jgi:NADPH2:quinone reductase